MPGPPRPPPAVRRKGKKNKQAQRDGMGTSSVTVNPGTGMLRLEIRQTFPVTPSLGAVLHHQIQMTTADYPIFARYSRVRINRVGIAVMPGSYTEFTVRPVGWTAVDTRTELMASPDCQMIRVLYGGCRIVWYKPTDPIHRGWQDISSLATIISTGLYIHYTGFSDYVTGATKFMFQERFDCEFDGIQPGALTPVGDASFQELVAEMEKRKQKTWSQIVDDEEASRGGWETPCSEND